MFMIRTHIKNELKMNLARTIPGMDGGVIMLVSFPIKLLFQVYNNLWLSLISVCIFGCIHLL